MGADKGELIVHDRPQVQHCAALLEGFCAAVTVSASREQAGRPAYQGLPLVFDAESVQGPAAGLLAAWDVHPGVALLVLAVDMPLANHALLAYLAAHRAPGRAATAFRGQDGILEPLCTIFEPPVAAELRRLAATTGAPSLRCLLEAADVAVLDPPDPNALISVNTPEALSAALATLGDA
jgi:molybdopterin-guanine dinucleotide biosynthesis protein A